MLQIRVTRPTTDIGRPESARLHPKYSSIFIQIMDLHLYGIATCDGCRKARRWLDGAGLDYRYTDLRDGGLKAPTIAAWADAVGWERLLNRRSTTWRGLAPAEREIRDPADAVRLMAAHPTLIKRPVLIVDGETTVGFGPEVRARLEAAA
jgi:Spx/MgsR family transcriptional regulator